jgi:hypothetical protein
LSLRFILRTSLSSWTRYSGDLPVRRWSRGRFAFRRAAVAPLFALTCIRRSEVIAAARRHPPFRIWPGGRPRARRRSWRASRDEAGMRGAGRCGPCGPPVCAVSGAVVLRPPAPGLATSAPDVSGAAAVPRTYTKRETSTTLCVVQEVFVSPPRPRVARRPGWAEALRKRLQCSPSQQTPRKGKRRKDAPRLDRIGDRGIRPTAPGKGTERECVRAAGRAFPSAGPRGHR